MGSGATQAQQAFAQATNDASKQYNYYANKYSNVAAKQYNDKVAGAHSGRGRFPPTKAIVDSWTDSELREFLLKNNIISPSSKTEELRLLAVKKLDDLAHVAASVKDTTVDNVVDAAHYAVHDAPRIAYDFASAALEGE